MLVDTLIHTLIRGNLSQPVNLIARFYELEGNASDNMTCYTIVMLKKVFSIKQGKYSSFRVSGFLSVSKCGFHPVSSTIVPVAR